MKLSMGRTRHALPQRPCKPLVVIFGPDHRLMVWDKTARPLTVAVLPLVGEALVQPGCQMGSIR